mgnify:CR=1 FL=1
MSIETGGPAFPSEGGHKFVSGNEIRKTLPSSGMTLRDYFAAKAMQGSLTGGGDFEKFSDLAADSYAIADAMLETRNKE